MDKKVRLLDCPGIVFASGSDANAGEILLRNCVKVEKIADPIQPVEAILRKCNLEKLMIRYKIPQFDGVQEFLSHVARRRGKLHKGGIPDYQDSARIVLQDWNNGGIPYYTIPPAEDTMDSKVYTSVAIVNTFAAEFDIDALLAEGDNDSVMVLPSIDSVPANDLVETMNVAEETGLDCMFTNLLSIREDEEETGPDAEAMVSDDDMDSDEGRMMDSDEEGDSTPHVANPIRPADDLNLQANKQLKKNLKKQKKKEKKERAANYVQDSFDFATDFVADNDGADDDDDDLLEM